MEYPIKLCSRNPLVQYMPIYHLTSMCVSYGLMRVKSRSIGCPYVTNSSLSA